MEDLIKTDTCFIKLQVSLLVKIKKLISFRISGEVCQCYFILIWSKMLSNTTWPQSVRFNFVTARRERRSALTPVEMRFLPVQLFVS